MNTFSPKQSNSSNGFKKYLKIPSVWNLERKRTWLAFAILLGGLTLTSIASLSLKIGVEKNAKKDFNFSCVEIKNKIYTRLHAHAQLLRSGTAFIKRTDEIKRDEWKNFYIWQRIEKNLPGIQGIGYSIIISPDQLKQHENKVRSESFPYYSVKPAGKRDIYTSIIFLEPFTGRNLRAFGYDMFSETIRRTAMEKARDFDIAAISAKIFLVQETNADVQAGTLMYVPVYKNGMPIETIEQRRHAIKGWVYSPYRMNDLMEGILGGYELINEKNIAMEIYDDSSYSKNDLLYDSKKATNQKTITPSLYTIKTSVIFNDHKWFIIFTQYVSGSSGPDFSKVWLTGIGGVTISLLLFFLFLSFISTNIKAYQLAENLTRDLSESEEKYRTIFKNEVYAISIFDLEGKKFIDVNERQCELYGYSREEFLSGKTFLDLTTELESSKSVLQKAAINGSTFIPLRYHKKKDGTIFPVEIVGGPYTWKGNKVMFALVHDITKRVKAEESLHNTKWRLERIIEGTHVGTWEWNVQTGETIFNDRWAQILGYTLDELAPISIKTWELFAHPDDLKKSEELLERHFSGELDYYEFESRMKHKNGHWVWIYDRGRIMTRTSDGKPLMMFGTHTDITERKNIEIKLQETFSDLKKSQRIAQIGNWKLDIRTNLFTASEEALELFGFPPNSSPTFQMVSECIVDEDREKATITLQNSLQTGESYSVEIRITRRDTGEIRNILSLGEIQFDSDRNPICVIGTNQEITERKQNENALIQSEAKLRAILENSRDAIGVHINGDWQMCNPAAIRLFGVASEDELLGQSILNVISEHERLRIRDYIKNRMMGKDAPLAYITRGLRKDGTEFDMEVSISNYTLAEVKYVLVILRDITERKQAEEALRYSQLFLDNIIERSPSSLWISDETGTMLRMNQACRDCLNIKDEDVVGKYNILNDNLIKEQGFMPLVKDVFAKGITARFVISYSTADIIGLDLETKTNVVLDVNISPILDSQGKVTNAIIQHIDITERKLAEEALKEYKLRLESTMIATNIAWWEMDVQTGKIIFNHRKAEMIGRLPEEFLHYNDFMKYIHPVDYEPTMQAMKDHFTGKKDLYETDYRISTATGEYKWFHDKGFITERNEDGKPVKVCGIVIDITERKKAEDALKESENKYHQLFDNMQEGFSLHEIITNESGQAVDFRFIDCNSAYETHTGFKRGETIGRTMLELMPDADRNQIEKYGRVVRTGEPMSFEYYSKIFNRYMNVRAFKHSEGRFATIFEDITDRKEIQLTLQKNYEKEHELNEMKNRFISMVSHEFRTPLTSILASSDFLEMGGENYNTEKKAKQFARIRRSIDYMINMLNEVLMINKMDRGKIEIEFEKTNLPEYCKELLNEVSLSYPGIKSNLIINLSSSFYNIDTLLMRNILSNLFSNAFRYNIKEGHVDISIDLIEDKLVYKISDTGVGIPENEKQRIFEPFIRMSNVKHIKGTGLGMSIIKNSVDQLGGEISFTSKENEGTTFVVSIPVVVLRN